MLVWFSDEHVVRIIYFVSEPILERPRRMSMAQAAEPYMTRVSGRDGENCVAIYIPHATRFPRPFFGIILDDAEAVNPQVAIA